MRADNGTRTRDPFITNEMLYQLSHVGGIAFKSNAKLVKKKDTANKKLFILQ